MAAESIIPIYNQLEILVKKVNADIKADIEVKQEIKDQIVQLATKVITWDETYLINGIDVFFASMFTQLDRAVDFSIDGPVDLKAVDLGGGIIRYKVLFNPLHMEGYKLKDEIGTLIAEILRLGYNHPAEFARQNKGRNPEIHDILEKASDAAVFSIIEKEMAQGFEKQGGRGISIPPHAYTVDDLNEEVSVNPKDLQPMEYYAQVLKKFRKNPPPTNSNASSANGQPANGGNNSKNNNQNMSAPGSGTGNSIHDWEGHSDQDLEDATKELVSQAWNSMTERQRGRMPGALAQFIKKFLAPPEINWKQIFRKMVGCQPVPYRKTKTRLNRRQPERADLSGRLPKRLVDILAVVDSSGSMQDRDLEYCLTEILSMVKGREFRLTVIECDAQIGKIYDAKKPSDIQSKISGRGGTSFIPVIDFINGKDCVPEKWKSHPKFGKCRDTLMIYFTDGFGDYEIERPMTYRNLWVVMNDEKNLSLKNPYGEVKSLSTDRDWQRMRNQQI